MNNRLNPNDFQAPDNLFPGTLLVASPALFGTPFRKSVVLVVQNNDEGTFGVVLNRPANEQLQFAWQELTGSDAENPNLVHGGPIDGPVFALHQQSSLAEMEMPSGICITSESEKFQEIVQQSDEATDEFALPFESSSSPMDTKEISGQYRIVFGIAGWQKGQLQREVHQGLWYQLDGEPERVFDDPEFMWEKSIRRYSRMMLCDVIGLTKIPINPLLN